MIARLRGHDYPLATGLVAAVGGREVYVPIGQVSNFDGDVLRLTSARLDLRRFERRPGEALPERDVLGHRLIDVETARLVRAAEVELERQGTVTGWWSAWTPAAARRAAESPARWGVQDAGRGRARAFP